MERPDTRRIWNDNAPAWTELTRAGYDVYRDLVNTPAFLALLPPVTGLLGLDLGCGEGHNTRLVAGRHARVVALDIAETFIRAAKATRHHDIAFVQGDGAALPFPDATFDFVTAFMSLMDVGSPEASLTEVSRVLRPGGFFQFSVGHPVTTTPGRRWIADEAGERIALAVGDYFYEGPMTESWTFGAAPEDVRQRVRPFEITYARRTVAGWLTPVLHAGLVITAVREPRADDEVARRHPGVADTVIAPYFLIVQARKPTPEATVT